MTWPADPIVVFDLGGVLVRICRSWPEGCAAAGVPVRDGTDADEMIMRRRALSIAYQEGLLTCDEFLTQVAEATGGVYTPDEIARIHDAWLLGLYDGVTGLIDELGQRGVTTGILSNTNHRHWTTMTRDYAPLSRITHPHASHLLRACKPDPNIYRLFEERTGAEPERIVFFDDLEENVAAAGECGWRAHQIDYTGDTAAQMRAHLHQLDVLPG